MADDRKQTGRPDAASATSGEAERGAGGETLAWPGGETARMPQAEDAARTDEPAAGLGDVRAVTGSFVRGRARTVGAAVRAHPLALALAAVAAVAVALAGTLGALRAANLPAVEAVEADARALADPPAYEGGSFGLAEPLEAVRAHLAQRRSAGDGQAEATVSMTWANGAVEATADVTLAYARDGGTWACAGATTGRAAFVATQGVDTERLARDAAARDELLRRAEATWQTADAEAGGTRTSLATLYRDAKLSVTDEDFDADAQTDVVVLHLVAAETFTAHEADVTARFAFRPGTGEWELTATEASAGAKDVGYAPLVGTWLATFAAQEASGPGKCFGAQGAQTAVTVEEADGQRISGTLSGLAHLHPELDGDAPATDGDAELADLAFEGTRVADAAGIAFDCTLPEQADGELALRLDFGSAERPDAALATLTSRHDYDATLLFVPYRREARFVDTFTLTKA